MNNDEEISFYKCDYCEKSFKKLDYRRRHIKNIHEVTTSDISKFICTLCDKAFKAKHSLKVHVANVHFQKKSLTCDLCSYKTNMKSNLKRHTNKVHQSRPTSIKKEFQCSLCNSSFTLKKKLALHVKVKHENRKIVPQETNRKCPLCDFSSHTQRKEEINNHFIHIHGIPIKWETYDFQNMEKFYDWKNKVETNTKTYFTKYWSSLTTFNYTCHRKGFYKKQGTNKRHLKIMGSCKIGAHCPSEIRANINKNGNITVLYMPTHVGHENQLKFLRLKPEDRKIIESQLRYKTPHVEILKGIRNSISNKELQRIHIVNRQDITNIEKSLYLNDEAEWHPFEKRKIVSKLKILRNRHSRALVIPMDHITYVGENKYNVLSSNSTELYTVQRLEQCSKCHLVCVHCQSCFHEYVCSCMDSVIKNNMCEHIHAVARSIQNGHRNQDYGLYNLEMDIEKDEKKISTESKIMEELSVEKCREDNIVSIIKYCDQIKEKLTSLSYNQKEYLNKELEEILTTLDA